MVFSAREIPGNEKAIGRVMNHIARRGADVVYEGIKHVHVSGHGSEEELKLMLSLVRPRYFVPIHGEYRQLARHARMARPGVPGPPRSCWRRTATCIRFDDGGGADRGARCRPAGSSSTARGAARSATRCCATGGTWRATGWSCRSSRSTGSPATLEETPDVITRGFVLRRAHEALLKEIPGCWSAPPSKSASVEERTDPGLIKEKIRVDLQRLFRKRSGRRPLVLPVVMEV